MTTPDPADELRRQIEYNTKNMGELGRYIRVEHVHAILDGYVIVADDDERTRQLSTLAKARVLFMDAPNERELLRALHRVLFG